MHDHISGLPGRVGGNLRKQTLKDRRECEIYYIKITMHIPLKLNNKI